MKLLGFTSHKQGGKDTCANFIQSNSKHLFPGWNVAPKFYYGKAMKDFAEVYFGLPRNKLWGTNEDKNELTHIRWETLPNYTSLCDRWYKAALDEKREYSSPYGRMTIRELLQYIGEDFILSMDPNCWVRAFEKEIKECYAVDVGVVADPRKPEQIASIHRLGGKVIRLLRAPFSEDRHISEIALDPDRYDQSNFDTIIDNRNLSIEDTNRCVLGKLLKWEWIGGDVDLSLINWNPKEHA